MARSVVGAGLFMALIAGCGGKPTLVMEAAQLGVAPAASPRLTVNPPDGAAGVSPTEKVTAAVIGGQLTGVVLTGADGAPVAGQLSPDGERWTSSVPLKPATGYSLKAASRAPSGEETTTVARFRTLAPGQNVTGKITPDDAGPVRADQAVSVLFDKPIANRQAVERAFRVTANPAATGKTQWKSDRELVWRPTPGWAPGSRVTVSLDIYGKQLGGNLIGAADLRRNFSVIDDGRGLALRAANSSEAPSSSADRERSGAATPPEATTFGAPNPAAAPSGAAKLPAGASPRPTAGQPTGPTAGQPTGPTAGQPAGQPTRPTTGQPTRPTAGQANTPGSSRAATPSTTPKPGTSGAARSSTAPNAASKPPAARSTSGSSATGTTPSR
jgi:hypothetical protein